MTDRAPNDEDALFRPRIGSLAHLHSGKVRELYAIDEARMLIVATDRLSAFDVILPTPIPGKGRMLTTLSNFQDPGVIRRCSVSTTGSTNDRGQVPVPGSASSLR